MLLLPSEIQVSSSKLIKQSTFWGQTQIGEINNNIGNTQIVEIKQQG